MPTVTGKVYNHSQRTQVAVLDAVAAALRRIIGAKPADPLRLAA